MTEGHSEHRGVQTRSYLLTEVTCSICNTTYSTLPTPMSLGYTLTVVFPCCPDDPFVTWEQEFTHVEADVE